MNVRRFAGAGKKWGKLLIYIYALFYHRLHRKNLRGAQNKEILIAFNGLIGDAVLFTDSMREYGKLFPSGEGYRISILCGRSTGYFLGKIMRLEGVDFLPETLDNADCRLRTYAGLLHSLGRRPFEKIIALPISSSRVDKLVYNLSAVEKILAGENPGDYKKPARLEYFRKRAYDRRIVDRMGTMELNRYRSVLRALGDKGFRSGLPCIPSLGEGFPRPGEAYCVVSLGSSGTEKNWGAARFARVIGHVTDVMGLLVCICGGWQDETLYRELIGQVDRTRVRSYIGKTTVEEWIELIRGGRLYIGNDSGGAHVAAAVGTPAVVIVGRFQYRRFFPYRSDSAGGDELTPCPVYSDKDFFCENCREKHLVRAYGNRACRKARREGRALLCIESVETEKVVRAVDAVLERCGVREERKIDEGSGICTDQAEQSARSGEKPEAL